MKLKIEPRYIQRSDGHAFFVQVRHPYVLKLADSSKPIRLWMNGVEVGTPVAAIENIKRLGDGRCLRDGQFIWFSLPGEVDPRTTDLSLVVEIPLRAHAQPGIAVDPAQSSPLLILGPQRSGSTALLWGLNQGTRYQSPKLVFDGTSQCEGYYMRQILGALVSEPLVSCFGGTTGQGGELTALHAKSEGFPTGIFSRAGFSDLLLNQLATHLETVYSTLSGAPGRWVEKSPGWEPVSVGPLFTAMFPAGRTIFLSREPASCVLSMLRLSGLDMKRVPADEHQLRQLTHTAAAWAVAHHVWRRYCAPVMPDGSYLQIPFSRLRSEPAAVVRQMRQLMGLSSQEEAYLLESLRSAPVKSHHGGRDEIQPELNALIELLCHAEGHRWGYEIAASAMPSVDLLVRAWKQFCRDIKYMLVALGLRRQYVDQLLLVMGDHVVETLPYAGNVDEGTAAAFRSAVLGHTPIDRPYPMREEDLPLAGVGPVLRAMLDSHPLAGGASVDVPVGSTPLEPTVVHEQSDATIDSSESANATAESVIPGRTVIQEYEGKFHAKQIEGRFWEHLSQQHYEWSARLVSRKGSSLHFACCFNGHKGVADVQMRRGRLAGVLRMGGRLDVLEGRVRGNHIEFTRSC